MVTFLVWLFFAVCCYLLAQKKDRNEIGWAVAGLIFGVFSFIVLLLLPSKKGRG